MFKHEGPPRGMESGRGEVRGLLPERSQQEPGYEEDWEWGKRSAWRSKWEEREGREGDLLVPCRFPDTKGEGLSTKF